MKNAKKKRMIFSVMIGTIVFVMIVLGGCIKTENKDVKENKER